MTRGRSPSGQSPACLAIEPSGSACLHQTSGQSPQRCKSIHGFNWAIALALAGWANAASAQVAGDAAVQNQWFTGSLEAPSPALSKAGEIEVEPYAVYTVDTGAYDNGGRRQSVPDALSQIQSVTVLKYGITDRLTVQALPSFAQQWAGRAALGGAGDLPIELEYRFNDENNRTGWPSVTTEFGVSLPTGKYDDLGSSQLGLGSGAYTLKEGILFQSLFDPGNGHPMRFRLYGDAFEPLGKVSLQGVSDYGTLPGFQGHAMPGFATEVGLGGGYAFSQRWVLALDLVNNYADGARLQGFSSTGSPIHIRGGASDTFAVAPAMEYNWSSRVGVIFGVEFSAAGRNAPSYVAPQVALSTSF